MDELINILSRYSLEDAIRIEQEDRQFLAICRLFDSIGGGEYFFPLIIANSLVGYQLSSPGEDYWEELFVYATKTNFTGSFSQEKLISFFEDFLPKSRGNKRLLNMKIPRLRKTETLFLDFVGKEEYYYENLLELQKLLSKQMKQDKDSKTILFALKMFHYGARLRYGRFSVAPFEVGMPIDSRITRIEKIYNTKNLKSQEFWSAISGRIGIPCLHLDAILWTRCNEFICI